MAHQTYLKPEQVKDDKAFLAGKEGQIIGIGAVAAVVGIAGALGLGAGMGDNLRGFWFAWLQGCCLWLSVALGALFFIMVMYAARGGWNVVVRRIAEYFAATLPVIGILTLIGVVVGGAQLYSWHPGSPVELEHHAQILLARKEVWLSPTFFAIRIFAYFAIWTSLAWYFLGNSLKQDSSGDVNLTRRMWTTSAPGLVIFAVTLTLAAFDLLMSLSPTWFSTIFGVYIFAGCVSSFMSILCITVIYLQSQGFLRRAITMEHYHDLGKLMFAFTFFWGYIAFSQYMLTWYANMPEEIFWYMHRQGGGWENWSWLLLWGKFIIPFAFLLNRKLKRNKLTLAFAALWIPIFHWVDLYYVIMPNFSQEHFTDTKMLLTSICATVFVGGVFFASAAAIARGKAIIPLKDPRLGESLRFDNIKV